MDLEKGKRIFYMCNGSHFFIDREYPKEYKKCRVPKEIEEQWLEEIKNNFLTNIDVKKGADRVTYISYYIHLLDGASAVRFLFEILKKTDFDTFSLIILAETLKHLSKDVSEQLKEEINNLLLKLKKMMLSNEIIIDESYKRKPGMKDYDFSNENVIRRINKI